MNDKIIRDFVCDLLNENIEEERFKQYIDIYSRFLGYSNPEYKYNGTYLSQCVNDFIQVYQMLKRKNEKYNEILKELIDIGLNFELLIDRVFYAAFSLNPEIESHYIEINKNRIVSKSIEIRICFESDNEQYIFCKEYDDFEDDKLVATVHNDIENLKI